MELVFVDTSGSWAVERVEPEDEERAIQILPQCPDRSPRRCRSTATSGSTAGASWSPLDRGRGPAAVLCRGLIIPSLSWRGWSGPQRRRAQRKHDGLAKQPAQEPARCATYCPPHNALCDSTRALASGLHVTQQARQQVQEAPRLREGIFPPGHPTHLSWLPEILRVPFGHISVTIAALKPVCLFVAFRKPCRS